MAHVTVITICYRNPDELRATLASLAPLDRQWFDLLVIDGSPDAACEQVSGEFAGVRHLRGPDSGKYDAMNKGIAAARGAALLFMNSGDLLASPDQLQAAVIAHADVLPGTLLYGDAIFEIGGVAVAAPAPAMAHARAARMLPSHQAILIPAAYHRLHPYDERMHFAADTKFLKGAFAALPSRHLPFAIARFGYGGVSNSAGSWRSIRQQLRELRDAEELTARETVATGLSLVRRKLLQAAFGEPWFRRVQRDRLIASGRARLLDPPAA